MTANLQIETAFRDKSFLQHVYYTPPFKVADITEDASAGVLQLMLMSASPGVLDGDRYKLQLTIGANSCLHLYTQSYQRLFTMKQGATQSIDITIAANASLFYLPHPTVPHVSASFTTAHNIYLSNGAQLFWGEIITCGRKGCGEVFLFSKYHSCTNVYYKGKPVLKENLLLRPAVEPLNVTGQWEGYTHQASFIYWNENMAVQSLADELHDLLKGLPALAFGVSTLQKNGLVIKLLGHAAEQLFNEMKRVASFICQQASRHALKPVLHAS